VVRKNNFDIVRLTLASVVVLVHSEALSDSPALAIIPRLVSSLVAVEGFFAISGFLIFASYERSTSVKNYFTNRGLRILPGYWLATLLCLAIAFFQGHFQVGHFLLANLSFANFLHPGIPGVFESNPENSAMNGALWTIKVEVMFYLLVPLLVWACRRWKRDVVLIGLYIASVAYRVILAKHNHLAVQLPGQLSFFMVGALVFYHRSWFEKHGRWLMLAAAVCFAIYLGTGWFVLRPAAVATLTLGICLLAPEIKGPTRWGDFSYGTYILHYPIVQVVIAAGLFRVHPWLAVALVAGLVTCAASLSWFLVEKPSLARSPSRRVRNASLGAMPNYPPAVP
jgi:peptidoglycan/LPS O-acetylase OafA/YrhL